MIEGPRPKPAPVRVLVVDDDRRVLELLEVAYSTQGFEVITAVDGDDAYRKALGEQPDLIVLDVRLPKRSGFEVCEALRRERGERAAPVILLSAAGETESRVHGITSGADDFLAKPFSPKELLARSRRLLARAKEAREIRQRAVELERELSRARDEVRRSHIETRREQRLRELAFGVGRDLARTLDLDTLARRFLGATHTRLGVGMLGLLLPGRDETVFELAGARGDAAGRLAGLTLAREGALARLLAALGRPVRRRELENVNEVAGELPSLIASGLVLVAPLVGPDGLEGVLVCDERRDGLEPQPHDLELVSGLCELVAGALRNARRYRVPLERAVEVLESVATDAEGSAARAEAAALAERAARATLLPIRLRGLLTHAVALGDAADAPSHRDALARLEAGDATGWVSDLIRLLDAARAPRSTDDAGGEPEWARAALLTAYARRLAIARAAGEALDAASVRAFESLDGVIDGDSRQALEAAVREALRAERPAA